MSEYKGNPELIAAGIRRLVKDEIANAASPATMQPQAEETSVSNLDKGGSGGYASIPAVKLGTGKGESGYAFSPSLGVFDPTEFMDAISTHTTEDGTPYYPRRGKYFTASKTIQWSAPLVDTAGRWLLLNLPSEDGGMQEMLDSYLIYREKVVESITVEKKLLAVVAHNKPVVGTLRNYLIVNNKITTNNLTGEFVIDDSLFLTKTTGTESYLELDLGDNENEYMFSYTDTTATESNVNYVYSVQAVTAGQKEGLILHIDPSKPPVTVSNEVHILPSVVEVGLGECFGLIGYFDARGVGESSNVTFSLSDNSGAAIANAPVNEALYSVIGVWAPSTAGTFTITATSVDVPTKYAICNVTVKASPRASVATYPKETNVLPTKTKTIFASVFGLTDKSTAWSVEDMDSVEVNEGSVAPPGGTPTYTFTHPVTSAQVATWKYATYTAPNIMTLTTAVKVVATADTQTTKASSKTVVYVKGDGGGGTSPGDFTFMDDWGYSVLEVDPSTGTYSTATLELRFDVTGDNLKEIDIYAVPIKDSMSLVLPEDEELPGAPSIDIASVGKLYVPRDATPIANKICLRGRNLETTGTPSSSNLSVIYKTGGFGNREFGDIEVGGYHYNRDGSISITVNDRRPAQGSLTDYFYDVTFTTTSNTLYLDNTSTGYLASHRYLLYQYTENGVSKQIVPNTVVFDMEKLPGTAGGEPLLSQTPPTHHFTYSKDSTGTLLYPDYIEIEGTNLDGIDGVYMYHPSTNAITLQTESQHTVGNMLNAANYEVVTAGTRLRLKDLGPAIHADQDNTRYIIELDPGASYRNVPDDPLKFYSYVNLIPVFKDGTAGPTADLGFIADTEEVTVYKYEVETDPPTGRKTYVEYLMPMSDVTSGMFLKEGEIGYEPISRVLRKSTTVYRVSFVDTAITLCLSPASKVLLWGTNTTQLVTVSELIPGNALAENLIVSSVANLGTLPCTAVEMRPGAKTVYINISGVDIILRPSIELALRAEVSSSLEVDSAGNSFVFPYIEELR